MIDGRKELGEGSTVGLKKQLNFEEIILGFEQSVPKPGWPHFWERLNCKTPKITRSSTWLKEVRKDDLREVYLNMAGSLIFRMYKKSEEYARA